MNGLFWLTGLIVLLGVVMSVLEYLVRSAAVSQQFKTIVPTLVDITAGVFHWGWIVVIALWIWGWERMRTKKYRKVHR